MGASPVDLKMAGTRPRRAHRPGEPIDPTSAALTCQCGGLLAEDDSGRIFCLKCEEEPCSSMS